MKIQKFKTLSSTNQKAKELANKGAAPWTIVVAEKQTSGYGKEKIPWFSPRGGLYFSIILPKSEPKSGANSLRGRLEDLQTLTILSAFIVAKTIKDCCLPSALRSQTAHSKNDNLSLGPLIKLPNDVLLNGKKVAGVLTENIIGKDVKLSVIGIGLNTNIEKFPKGLENSATSLKIELGKEVSNMELIKRIVQGLKEQLKTISE